MSPKHHHVPLSGGDRKALTKELSKSRAMTRIFAERSAEKRREGEALIREADNLACQSWNEKMWSDGGPIDPSPTIDQAINGVTHGLRSSARVARHRATLIYAPCPTSRQPASTISPVGSCVRSARRRRPAATLLQLAPRPRHQWLQDFVSLRAARAHDQANARAGDRGLAYVWMHPDEDR